MVVRVYLRSPAALAWTLAAIVGVCVVVALGWGLGVLLASTVVSDLAFLDGFGALFVSFFVAVGVFALAVSVWIPCNAAIAYAVGREIRGRPATLSETVDIVRRRSVALLRWGKTRVAVGPIAEYLLTEDDVSPAEVAAGCGAFVVPALVLDAPTLSWATERANRIVPRRGRRRIHLVGLAATTLLSALTWGIAEAFAPAPSAAPFAVFALVVGLVVTAAIDTAWRTDTYVTADLDDPFSS